LSTKSANFILLGRTSALMNSASESKRAQLLDERLAGPHSRRPATTTFAAFLRKREGGGAADAGQGAGDENDGLIHD